MNDHKLKRLPRSLLYEYVTKKLSLMESFASMSGHGGGRKGSGRKKAVEQPPPKGQPRLSFAPPNKAVTETLAREVARESREELQSAHEKRNTRDTVVAAEK
jgi:hypothetical protein